MHALEDVLPVLPGQGQNALGAEDVGAPGLDQLADPGGELPGVQRPVHFQRDAGDGLVVLVIVVAGQQPGLDVEDARQVEGAPAEDAAEIHAGPLGLVHGGVRIDGPDAGLDLVQLVGGDEIDLVEQDGVGEGDLFQGLVAVVDAAEEVVRVHQRHHRVQGDLALDVLVDEERLHHRRRVGEAGGFDEDAVEAALALEQGGDDVDQVAAHGAADAAVVHLEHFFVGVHHQVVVDALLAEFVDDDGVFLAVLFGQDPVQQGRLARAQVAGQHGYGNFVFAHPSNSLVRG